MPCNTLRLTDNPLNATTNTLLKTEHAITLEQKTTQSRLTKSTQSGHTSDISSRKPSPRDQSQSPSMLPQGSSNYTKAESSTATPASNSSTMPLLPPDMSPVDSSTNTTTSETHGVQAGETQDTSRSQPNSPERVSSESNRFQSGPPSCDERYLSLSTID